MISNDDVAAFARELDRADRDLRRPVRRLGVHALGSVAAALDRVSRAAPG